MAKKKEEFVAAKGSLEGQGEDGHEWNQHAGEALSTLADDLKGTVQGRRSPGARPERRSAADHAP